MYTTSLSEAMPLGRLIGFEGPGTMQPTCHAHASRTLSPATGQALAGKQGDAGAGEPPGQTKPGAHCVALAEEVEPAAQPKPGAAAQAPEQRGEESPGESPKYPAGHVVQAVASAEEKVPGAQIEHVVSEVAPSAALAVPAGQAVALAEEEQ